MLFKYVKQITENQNIYLLSGIQIMILINEQSYKTHMHTCLHVHTDVHCTKQKTKISKRENTHGHSHTH